MKSILALTILAALAFAQPAEPGQIAAVQAPAAKPNSRACLVAARAALARGNLDEAEDWTLAAEQAPAGFGAWAKNRWADSPAKLWQAIQTARLKETARLIASIQEQEKIKPTVTQPTPASKTAKETTKEWPTFRPVKSPAAQRSELVPDKTSVLRATVTRTSANVAVAQDKFFGIERKSEKKAGRKDALELLAESARALAAGDSVAARSYALEARKLRSEPAWRQEDFGYILAYLLRKSRLQAEPPPAEPAAVLTRQMKPDANEPPTLPSRIQAAGSQPAPPLEDMFIEECEPESSQAATPARRWSQTRLILIGAGALIVAGLIWRVFPRGKGNRHPK